jgi:murein DD-endopeptidase MepM/ murein hydrolase activator NlpD
MPAGQRHHLSRSRHITVLIMRNQVTFILLSGNGSKIRQFSSTRRLLGLGLALVVACLSALGVLARDYQRLRGDVARNVLLEQSIAKREHEISFQHQQIESFANEINNLKERLLALNEFERQIRVIANLDHPAEQENLFGIGGSTPEDLDPGGQMKRDQANLLRNMHEQVEQLEIAAIQEEKGMGKLMDALTKQRNLLACTPSIRPAKGWISSQFGYRTSPFTGRREFHSGVDIANSHGTSILATADGVVSFSGPKHLLGNLVVVDHGHGLVTRYGHVEESLVKRGAKVKRGALIAKMGNTGRSTGPHVHYEVRLNGLPVDPVKYILN